jgi:hypothetical protein
MMLNVGDTFRWRVIDKNHYIYYRIEQIDGYQVAYSVNGKNMFGNGKTAKTMWSRVDKISKWVSKEDWIPVSEEEYKIGLLE